jgi:cytochrome c
MRNLLLLVMLAGLVVGCSVQAIADDATECEALVRKAVAMCKDRGRQAVLTAIDNPSGPFVRNQLYVFAISLSMNVMTAHPHDKTIKGIPMGNIIDKNGHKFFGAMKEVAQNPGFGWVEYTWGNPGEAECKRKRSFIMRVPDEDLYFGAGYYVK